MDWDFYFPLDLVHKEHHRIYGSRCSCSASQEAGDNALSPHELALKDTVGLQAGSEGQAKVDKGFLALSTPSEDRTENRTPSEDRKWTSESDKRLGQL